MPCIESGDDGLHGLWEAWRIGGDEGSVGRASMRRWFWRWRGGDVGGGAVVRWCVGKRYRVWAMGWGVSGG